MLSALSGLLLALSYPGWGFGVGSGPAGGLSFLIWVGLAPLFFAFLRFTKHSNILQNVGMFGKSDGGGAKTGRKLLKKYFLLGFTAGLVYFLIIFRWFWSIFPLDTLGVENIFASFFVVLVIWFISAAGMAVWWGAFATVYSLQFTVNSRHKLLQKLVIDRWPLITLPALFVLFEYLRSWGFGILWAGSGSLFGAHWTMGNLAYSLADNSLARWLVPYIGIYGISFLVVLVNLLFARAIVGCTLPTIARFANNKPSTQRFECLVKPLFVIAIIFLLAAIPHLFVPSDSTSGKSINYALIQTKNPTRLVPNPKEVLANFKNELEMLKRVAKEYPETEIVVFPEASDFFKNLSLFLTTAQAETFFKNLFNKPVLVVAGGRIMEPTGLAYSRAFLLDTQGDILNYYDKRLLTPGGEFLPYPLRFITNLFSRLTVSQYGEFRELGVGQKDVSTTGFRYQFNVAPIICSEFWSPGLTAKTTQNTDLIIGMSSYGVFKGDLNIVRQNLAAARLRAAENRKPMIIASNLGLSYALDSRGNILKIAADSAPQILTGNVHILLRK